MFFFTLIALFALVILILFIIGFLVIEKPPNFSFKGKHVVITGGSSGIGLSTAQLLVKEGCNVTIVARNKNKLKDAETQLASLCIQKSQKINTLSVDVSNEEECISEIRKICEKMGGCDAIISNAGSCIPGYFDEMDLSSFKKMMDLNYFGTVYAIRAVLPFMKQKRSGRIFIVSSMAGLSGIIGMSAYSPSKFAVRGLAEALQMEYYPWGIFTSLVCPPDVDTPGLKEENKIKPIECKLISEGSGLFQPEDIAKSIISAFRNYSFYVTAGFDGHALCTACTGFAPISSYKQLFIEFFGMGFLRLGCLLSRYSFNNICKAEQKKRN